MKLIDRLHKRWLELAMRKFASNKSHAAAYLGISIRTLRNWEIKFGMRPKNKRAGWR